MKYPHEMLKLASQIPLLGLKCFTEEKWLGVESESNGTVKSQVLWPPDAKSQHWKRP